MDEPHSASGRARVDQSSPNRRWAGHRDRRDFSGIRPTSEWLKAHARSVSRAVKGRPLGKAPFPICYDWWEGPVVIREETDPPGPLDPDRCSSCGRQRPEGLILEMVAVRP